MFTFAQPFAFLLVLPALALAWQIYSRRRRAALLYSATRRLPDGITWRIRLATSLPALMLAGLLLMIVALARPRTVLSSMRQTADVIAIQMVIDISGSMEALDLSDFSGNRIVKERNRLDAVKTHFTDFIQRRPSDLIGLITFGGYATSLVPLTLDHDALLHVLDGVYIPGSAEDPHRNNLIHEEGMTAIGDGLATALARLRDVSVASRIVVLLSDGENNTGAVEPLAAAQAARDLGIKVYTIGIGRDGPSPFKVRDMFGRESIRMLDEHLDEALLREIATITGGEYFNVQNPKGFSQTMETIDQLERTEIEQSLYQHYDEWFGRFLLPGLLLIAGGSILNMLIARRLW